MKNNIGDYPVLDFNRSRFYRWLRQGSVALLLSAAIVSFTGQKTAITGPAINTLRVEHKSENIAPGYAKNVFVNSIAADDEFQRAGSQPSNLVCTNGAVRFARQYYFTVLTDLTARECIGRRKSEWNSICVSADPCAHSGRQSASGRLPGISQGKAYFEPHPRHDVGRLNVRWSDIGADLSLSNFSSDGIRIAGSNPHFFAGLPQSPREPRDGHSSNGGNNTFYRVKGFSDLNQDEWREVIGGALFIAGLGFLAYLMRRT